MFHVSCFSTTTADALDKAKPYRAACDIICNLIISVAILNFWLPVSSVSVIDSTIEIFDLKNMGVAVDIVFLASLEAEISLGGVVLIPPSTQTSLK